MRLWPIHSETLVSALSKEEVLAQLNRVTGEEDYLDPRSRPVKPKLFNGIVGKNGFRISKVVRRADTFLPIIQGKIESTPRGSILFISYKLFPGSLSFLLFWSVMLAGFTIYYLLFAPNMLYAFICLTLGVINHGLAMYFFDRQVKRSREVFFQLINFQMKD